MFSIIRGPLRDFPSYTCGSVRPVLAAMSSTDLFVVCGAGQAVPVVPTMEKIMRLGIDRYHQIVGSYPIESPPVSTFRSRWIETVVSSQYKGNWEWHKDLLMVRGTPESLLETLFEVQIFRVIEPLTPANYRVFLYVPAPALFFDFNTDGLLRKYCVPPHMVINPHGFIDRRLLEALDRDELLRFAAHGLQVTRTWFWLPGPEPDSITRSWPYLVASRALSQARDFFLLIGYSFGRQPGGKIDDAESFEFLCDRLKRTRRRLVVVDPSPDHVAGLLENALHQKVHVCNLYWNQFAECALEAMSETPEAPNLRAVEQRIARLYDEATR